MSTREKVEKDVQEELNTETLPVNPRPSPPPDNGKPINTKALL